MGGGDIRGVQLAGCCKHAVGVRDDGDKAGGADDGSAAAAVGGDIRGVQLTGCFQHDVDVSTMGTKPGERMMGQLERRTEVISGEFNS